MPLVFTKPQIRRYLAEMGIEQLEEDELEAFVKDLKKLIKHEDRAKRSRRKHQQTVAADSLSQNEQQQPPSFRVEDEPDLSGTLHTLSLHGSPERKSPRPSTSRAARATAALTRRDSDGLFTSSTAARLGEMNSTAGSESLHTLSIQQTTANHRPVSAPVFSGPSGATDGQTTNLPVARSSVSVSTSGSSSVSCGSARKKPAIPESIKRDPVALYHYYQSYWTKHKPPGVDRHLQLRWNVRAGTMGRVPCTPCGERVNYLTRY